MTLDRIDFLEGKYLDAADVANSPVQPVLIHVQGVFEAPKLKRFGNEDGETDDGREDRKVLISRGEGKKGLIANPTNTWAIAFLLGTKDPRKWIGKRLELVTDIDTDPSGKGKLCQAVRVVGSPDATPDRAREFTRIWNAGDRKHGKLVKRIKAAYKLLAGSDKPLPRTAPKPAADRGESSTDRGESPTAPAPELPPVSAPEAAPEAPPVTETEAPRMRIPGEDVD